MDSVTYCGVSSAAAALLAAAEASVLEAQVPLELFAAEIAVATAQEDLQAKESALVALGEAAAVPAL